MNSTSLSSRLLTFRKETDGAASIIGLYFFLVGAMILGIVMDQANGWRVQTKMQVAADAAAMAAAANLDDIDEARNIAMQVVNRNLADERVIVSNDITFGSLDENTFEFVSAPTDDGEYTAVHVLASRTLNRDNPLPTYLLKLSGVSTLDITAGSVAVSSAGDGSTPASNCADAMFLSTSTVQTGGSNNYTGSVCIHGEQGVSTGGSDYYSEFARVSSPSRSDSYLASYSPSDRDPDDILVERSMQPTLLPELDNMHNSIWNDLFLSRTDRPDLWEKPATPWGGEEWYFVGEYQLDQDSYDGILPSFLFDDDGMATVHMRENYWGIQPGELEEHTIYMSSDSIQFAGGVAGNNIAIITERDIGVGGGNQLFFDDVYFSGSTLNLSGNVEWGDEEEACGGAYNVYLFGTTRLSLGGWSQGSSVNGMVGAAPSFNPGGAMWGTGVYFETSSHLDMGGNYDIFGCDAESVSEFPLADRAISGDDAPRRSVLYR